MTPASPAIWSTAPGPTDQSKWAPPVPVSTTWSSRQGTTSSPGASFPQCERVIHTFTVWIPWPRKAPSWCQSASGITGTRRRFHFLTDSGGPFAEVLGDEITEPDLAEDLEGVEGGAGDSTARSLPVSGNGRWRSRR